MTSSRGLGSIRQRRDGVWEVRVSLGPDLISGRSEVKSLTVFGSRDTAQDARRRYAAEAARVRAHRLARAEITLADLLQVWLDADHGWKPSTTTGYRSIVNCLARDALSRNRAVDVTTPVLRAATARWRCDGVRDPTVFARVRALRSCLRWAYAERIIDRRPLDGMRGPPQPSVRLHAPVEAVRDLIALAQRKLSESVNDGARHKNEQVLLLVRLAADSGARRGELDALRLGDLDGDVLTISRAVSAEVVGSTKSGRVRRLTLGCATAALWRSTVQTWRTRAGGEVVGPWLFSADPLHVRRLSSSALGRWFADLGRPGGVSGRDAAPAAPHRGHRAGLRG
jgi:site-specific recombinase XerC